MISLVNFMLQLKIIGIIRYLQRSHLLNHFEALTSAYIFLFHFPIMTLLLCGYVVILCNKEKIKVGRCK